MATLPNAAAELARDEDPGVPAESTSYPETWLWDEHGDVCAGRFVRFDKAATRDYGKKLIMILEVDGLERSIWLLQTALYERIRDELSERPDHKLSSGERVAIHRLAETTTQDGKRSYRPFRIYFPDRPELDVASEFGLVESEQSRVMPELRQPELEPAEEQLPAPTTGSSDALDSGGTF
jgi:hypothetical protein